MLISAESIKLSQFVLRSTMLHDVVERGMTNLFDASVQSSAKKYCVTLPTLNNIEFTTLVVAVVRTSKSDSVRFVSTLLEILECSFEFETKIINLKR